MCVRNEHWALAHTLTLFQGRCAHYNVKGSHTRVCSQRTCAVWVQAIWVQLKPSTLPSCTLRRYILAHRTTAHTNLTHTHTPTSTLPHIQVLHDQEKAGHESRKQAADKAADELRAEAAKRQRLEDSNKVCCVRVCLGGGWRRKRSCVERREVGRRGGYRVMCWGVVPG